MKNGGLLLALSLASLVVGVGCSSPPGELRDADDYTGPSKSKSKAKDDGDEEGATLPNKTKSDKEAPAPAPAPPATPSTPATPPPAEPAEPPAPTVDPQSCANLGQCCSQLTNTYAQLACLGVQLRGDQEICAKSLIACKVSTGLGGAGGGGP